MSGPYSAVGARHASPDLLIEHLQLILFVFGCFLRPATQRTADHPQHLDGFQRLFRHEDPLILKGRVRRDHAIASRFGLKKVVGDEAFQRVPVPELELDPESGGFRARGEGSISLPGFGVFEIANETNGFGLGVGKEDQGSLGSQEFHGVRLEPARGLDEALQRFPVKSGDQNLLVCR